jgi:CelD/BcsL family acetyltransferase involved in cellulose biosynthesis
VEGQSIAGFFPCELRRFGVGVPVCGWPGTLCQGLVHAPGAEWDPRELVRACGLSVWHFDHVTAEQQPFMRFRTGMAPSPVMDLADGFAAYHAKLRVSSPRFCRDIARRARNLAQVTGELRFEAGSRDSGLLRTLMAWKAEQYRRIGAIDRFSRPWFVGLLETLLAARGDHFSGLLTASYAGGHPVAAHFGLRSGDLVAAWFTAYDTRFRKYSPGLIQFMHMAEALAAAGVHTIDLGEGGARYKEELKSRDIFVARGIVSGQPRLQTVHRASVAAGEWGIRAVLRCPRAYRLTRSLRSALRRTGQPDDAIVSDLSTCGRRGQSNADFGGVSQ